MVPLGFGQHAQKRIRIARVAEQLPTLIPAIEHVKDHSARLQTIRSRHHASPTRSTGRISK